jgi:molecular chaperone IbpA
MNTLDLTPIFRSAIGFDRMANMVDSMMAGAETQSNWPPYNIEKHGDDDYRISMAVAGFKDSELDVTVHDQMLIIRGTQSDQNAEQAVTYLHRGIAGRNFERRFQLADFIQVHGASIENGLLHIELQRVIPEAMKPRKINISSANYDAEDQTIEAAKPKVVGGKAR